ncbi:MAG: winged helix-turn-helix domain-containing protein [Methanosarcinales archaeon]
MENISKIRMLSDPEATRILYTLKKFGDKTSDWIADHLNYPKSTTSKRLKELERAGLVLEKMVNSEKHYSVKDFRILLTQDNIVDILDATMDYSHHFKTIYGKEKYEEVLDALEKVHRGELTIRMAAASVDVPYVIFMNLYLELYDL